ANPHYMSHLDDEFAATKVCARMLTRIPQFVGPGRNERSFHNQPPLPRAVDNGDLQHRVPAADGSKMHTKLAKR
ncbi:MAG: hypothetical protein WCC37_23420, partial [Candidatus Sulfotelmatobacter sp.]